MTTSIDLYTFLSIAVLLVYSSSTDAIGPALKYTLQPDIISPGKRTRVRLEIPTELLEGFDPDEIEIQDSLITESKKIQLMERTRTTEKNYIAWTYVVTALLPGRITIPPISITVGPTSYSTERKILKIVSAREASDLAIRPGFGKIRPPLYLPPWFWWSFLGLGIFGVAGYFLWRRYRHLFEKPEPVPTTFPPPPESDIEWLKKELDRLKTRLSEGPDDESLVDDFSFVLRGYFARRYGKGVRCWTTSEIGQRLTRDSRACELQTIFKQCDHFKFTRTGQSPKELTKKFLSHSERILFPCN